MIVILTLGFIGADFIDLIARLTLGVWMRAQEMTTSFRASEILEKSGSQNSLPSNTQRVSVMD